MEDSKGLPGPPDTLGVESAQNGHGMFRISNEPEYVCEKEGMGDRDGRGRNSE